MGIGDLRGRNVSQVYHCVSAWTATEFQEVARPCVIRLIRDFGQIFGDPRSPYRKIQGFYRLLTNLLLEIPKQEENRAAWSAIFQSLLDDVLIPVLLDPELVALKKPIQQMLDEYFTSPVSVTPATSSSASSSSGKSELAESTSPESPHYRILSKIDEALAENIPSSEDPHICFLQHFSEANKVHNSFLRTQEEAASPGYSKAHRGRAAVSSSRVNAAPDLLSPGLKMVVSSPPAMQTSSSIPTASSPPMTEGETEVIESAKGKSSIELQIKSEWSVWKEYIEVLRSAAQAGMNDAEAVRGEAINWCCNEFGNEDKYFFCR